MQDQGKRLLIAVGLALVVMFAWQRFFSPPPKKPPPAQLGSGSQVATGSGAAPTSTPAGGPSSVGSLVNPTASQCGPESEIKLAFPNVDVTFCSFGGVLTSWHLTDKRYDRDKSKGELMPSQAGAGAFAVSFPNSTFKLPADAAWKGTKVSDREVRYSIETENLSVEKRFVLVPEAYLIKLTITTKAKVPAGTEARQLLEVSTYAFQNPKDDGGGGKSVSPRRWESASYRNGEHLGTIVNKVQQQPRFEYNVTWSGFEHPFLLVALAPRPVAGLAVEKQAFADAAGLMRNDMLFHPADVLRPDSGPVVREISAYLGPKNYKTLENADSIVGFAAHFDGTIDLGWFGFIGSRLMWLLLQFYALLHNWGLSIVLLTICVKALTIPLVTKSMRSMKAMAVLKPQLDILQAKYKDDKQRLQMETMALYKQNGANPLTGCLPMLLQMPIWLALYRMLSATGELYQQPFIPGWIDDLTNSDPYHVLPVILMVTMFLQARLQPMGPVTDPSQKLQQRMMQYGLPLMFGVMSFFFPAGLTLYIFTNTILSAMHSIYMNKFDKKSLELAAKIKKAQAEAAEQKASAAVAKAKNANPPAKNDDADDDETSGSSASKPAVRPGGGNRPKRKKKRNK